MAYAIGSALSSLGIGQIAALGLVAVALVELQGLTTRPAVLNRLDESAQAQEP